MVVKRTKDATCLHANLSLKLQEEGACLPDGWVCIREGDGMGEDMSEVGKGLR